MSNKPTESVNVTACCFNNTEFAVEKKDQGNDKGFSIVGYSGGIITDHWYWGNVAFDLKGLKFAKPNTPVLEEHFTSRRIGFATKQDITDKVVVEGKFLENENAVQMANDLKSGFPMEASLYVPPSVVEQVAEGASVEVNGMTLKGPGAVFRKAVIKEVSMCVFGADSDTKSVAASANNERKIKFNLIKENIQMAKIELTIEQFKSEYPDLHKQVFEAGANSAKERFTRLQKACGDDNDLLVKCFAEGLDTADAMEKRIEKMAAVIAQQNQKLTAAPVVPAAPTVPVIAAGVSAAQLEFNNQPAPAVAPVVPAAIFDEANATDDELKAHFKATKELQDIYSGADAYIANIRHPQKK